MQLHGDGVLPHPHFADGLVGEVPGLDAHKVVEHLLGGPVGEAAEDVLRAVHVDDGLGLLKAQVGGVVIPRADDVHGAVIQKQQRFSLIRHIRCPLLLEFRRRPHCSKPYI